MELKEYFASKNGTSILATSDSHGNVNAAVYSKPHIMDDGTLAFIMNDRLSHANVQSNPKAAYLFIEKGSKREGKRLFLTWLREEENSPLLEQLRRHRPADDEEEAPKRRFLVFFSIDKVIPLTGV
jgi:hypothetical protein